MKKSKSGDGGGEDWLATYADAITLLMAFFVMILHFKDYDAPSRERAAEAIRDEVAGRFPRKKGYDFPDIRDGIIGMAFIETVVKSSKSKVKWVKFPRI